MDYGQNLSRARHLVNSRPRVRRIPRRSGFGFSFWRLWRVGAQLEVRERVAQINMSTEELFRSFILFILGISLITFWTITYKKRSRGFL